MSESLFAALAERWLDPENDDPAEWTDEMLMKRIEDLVGEGWHHAGKETARVAELERALLACAEHAGADTSGGAPTSPPLAEWAVAAVRNLRLDYEAEVDPL